MHSMASPPHPGCRAGHCRVSQTNSGKVLPDYPCLSFLSSAFLVLAMLVPDVLWRGFQGKQIDHQNGRDVGRDFAVFTLFEAHISATLLLLGGIVAANLFGMRMFQLPETKLRAGDGARKSLVDEIRKCSNTWLGDVTNRTFVRLLDTDPQVGSALLIQPTTNATNLVLYFLDRSDQSVRRSVMATGKTTILAQAVTNPQSFAPRTALAMSRPIPTTTA